MGDIVELSGHIMQKLRPGESMDCLDLRAEMTKNYDGWHLRSDQDGSD